MTAVCAGYCRFSARTLDFILPDMHIACVSLHQFQTPTGRRVRRVPWETCTCSSACRRGVHTEIRGRSLCSSASNPECFPLSTSFSCFSPSHCSARISCAPRMQYANAFSEAAAMAARRCPHRSADAASMPPREGAAAAERHASFPLEGVRRRTPRACGP